jgi:hypothetical protein
VIRCTVTLLALVCVGCVMGIPDAAPPFKAPKECKRWVIVQPENRAYCMTDEEFWRAVKGVLY